MSTTPTRLNVNKNQKVPPSEPSPTHSNMSSIYSMSWMAEKTTKELIPMLKNAYTTLKDKEKDLVLAAQIGKSLLEHNVRLKSSYDTLLQNTPPITPSTSTTSQNIPNEVYEDDMRFIPSRAAREAMIEVLEEKNSELTKKLEKAVFEQEKLKKTSTKSTRKLENEIALLQDSLDIATQKIMELEEINLRQKERHMKNTQEENKLILDELYDKVGKMERDKETAAQSKLDLETRLATTLRDLRELRNQCEQFEFTRQDFEKLQEAYERQYTHIGELKTSLEEHQSLIQTLNECGVSIHSTSSSAYYEKPSLLGELESEWHKRSSLLQKEISQNSLDTISQSSLTESILSSVSGINQQMIDDAIQFINEIEAEHKTLDQEDDHVQYPISSIYPDISCTKLQLVLNEPKGFTALVSNHIKQVFSVVWRWCRFSIIITTAIIISAWKGPDSLLIT